MATVYELQEEQAGLFAQMKGILEKADEEARELTAEEEAKYGEIEADLEGFEEKIEEAQKRAEAADERRARLEQHEERLKRPRNPSPPQRRRLGNDGATADDPRGVMERLADASYDMDRRDVLRSFVEESYKSEAGKQRSREFNQWLVGGRLPERSALQVDTDAAGGTLVAAEEFVARLIIGLDEMVDMRQISTVLPMISAESLGVPTLSADPADADWTAEIATGTADSTMATGKRNLHPHPLGKRILVSKTLLRRSAVPAEALVNDRLRFKFAVTEEKGFLTGSGANQPLGVFTASADGISTGQDVSTDNTTTAFTADGLINAKFNLASQYLRSGNLRWVFHRDSVKMARKLKDGNGQYLWSPGLSGEPNTILDVPYIMSEFAPNTFTTGLYVGIIGDFTWYWIADSLMMTVQRLQELYAATNQDGFIGRLETDGMPVLEEAFTRVTLA